MNDFLKRVQSDVDAMNKALGVPDLGDATDPPETEAVKTDAPETEVPTTELPSPKTASPKTEVPTTEAPMDEKDKTILELRTRLAEREKPAPKTKHPTTDAPLNIDAQDFVGDLDVADLSKEELNKLLNSVYSKGIGDSVKIAKGIIPRTVSVELDTMERLKKVNEEFYSANEDLKAFQKVVATVFGELSESFPDKSMIDLLKETGPEVRKRLSLPDKPNPKPKPKETEPPPKLPGKKGGSGRKSEDKPLTGISAEIAEMNETLGR
jgi:hypothetical protein